MKKKNSSLPTIGTCLQDTFSNCTDDAFQTIRNIIMRVFVDAMRDKLKNCYFRVSTCCILRTCLKSKIF